MHRKVLRNALGAIALSASVAAAAAAEGAQEGPLRPIIAQVIDAPQEFEGREVQIYGLVVGADIGHKRFMLQDVSQRPLLVDARALPTLVRDGDQVEVAGTIKAQAKSLSLEASDVKWVQVVAGGGCC